MKSIEPEETARLDRRFAIEDLVAAFLAGGITGWLYEVFICGPLNGEEINLLHGGLGIPFLTIYGAGAVIIAAVLWLPGRKHKWYVDWLLSALLCTAVELSAGLVMLHVIGVQTWDYRLPGWDFMCSPDGLICLRASATFGLMGILLLKGVLPCVSKHRSAMASSSIWVLAAIVLAAVLNANLLHIVDVGGQWQ